MKSYKKLTAGAVLALSLVGIPTVVAHADEGVVTNDFSVKNADGTIIKEFKPNEAIRLDSETDKHYRITIDGQVYEVNKEPILKTIKHEEESLSIAQKQITLKTTPNYFGNVILTLNKNEVVHRIPEAGEQNGFIKVRTSQNVEGWLIASSVKQNIKNIPLTTKAYVDEDSEQEKSLYYGDSVTIIGFENNQYKVSMNDNSLLVSKDAISFTEPPKKFQSPIQQSNPRITSLPGFRIDPVYGGTAYHGGTDIAIPQNTPIYATADGRVIKTHTGETYNNGAGYGNYVKLSHAEGITSVYAHLTSLTVQNGQYVKQGELIGYSGSTGKSTGNHLHFEMEKNDVLVDTSLIVKEAVNTLKSAPK